MSAASISGLILCSRCWHWIVISCSNSTWLVTHTTATTEIYTHDHPVSDPVWELYAHACRHFGETATLLERDDHIPPIEELMRELAYAKTVQEQALSEQGLHDQGLQEQALRPLDQML